MAQEGIARELMADEGPAVYHTAARGQGKAPGLRSTAAEAEAKAWDCGRYGSLQKTRTAPLAPGLLACSPLLSAPEASHAQSSRLEALHPHHHLLNQTAYEKVRRFPIIQKKSSAAISR